MEKVIVVSPFQMAGRKYEIGDSVNLNEEQKGRFAQLGLVKVEGVKEKKLEKAPVDKMVKSAPKKKSRSKRKKK